MSSADLSALPLRNERGAPQFDDSSRDTVEKYFSDLERLLGKHNIIREILKKLAAVDYPPADVGKRWKSLPTYDDAAKTYVQFKEEVLSFYIGNDASHIWTLREYNEVIGEALRTGIQNLDSYMKFYGKFYPIYRYLVSKTQPELTERDASTALLRLVPMQAASAVAARLAQKVPDKHSEEAYNVSQVHEAISYCLADGGLYGGLGPWASNPAVTNLAAVNPPAPAQSSPPQVVVKTENDLSSFKREMMSMMTSTVRDFLSQQRMQASQPPPFQPQYQSQAQPPIPGRFQQQQPGMYAPRPPMDDNCIYCGFPGAVFGRALPSRKTWPLASFARTLSTRSSCPVAVSYRARSPEPACATA